MEASGTFLRYDYTWASPFAVSGDVIAGAIGSGAVIAGGMGSGAVMAGTVGSGAIVSGALASGQIGRYALASGTVVDLIASEQAISGIVAVAWGSGGCFVVPAERQSGFRLPAIGVVAGNFVSGDIVPVVRRGIVTGAASGLLASGCSKYLYVGSGGLLVNLSGFMGGTSSGVGPNPTVTGGVSGQLVQRIGVAVSGGIDVNVGEVTSGLLSGSLGAY